MKGDFDMMVTVYGPNGPETVESSSLVDMTAKIKRGIYWRSIRNRIETNLAFFLVPGTIEYENARRRVRWTEENRLRP